MAEKPEIIAPVEAPAAPAEPAKPAEASNPEKPVEKSVEEIIEEAAPTPEPKKPKTVGLDKYLDERKEKKALQDRVKELETQIEKGATPVELSDDIAALADEFDVNKEFLGRLTKVLEARSEAKAEETIAPIKKKDRDALIDNAFNTYYAAALDAAPEFKDIANAEVIKALSLLPSNSKKTFANLLEETYGKATTGKRSIDNTKPGGGNEPEPLDFARARKDNAYFAEVMANPALKKEYNARMIKST